MASRNSQIALTASLASFLTSLDASAVTATLPVICAAFHASIPAGQWVLLAELAATSGLLLALGKFADRCGHKRVHVAGYALFVVGCACCTLAPGLAALIAFRIVQGIGSAMLLATSPALVVQHISAERRGRGLGLRSAFLYLGLVAGPALAGWLAGHYGWRAVFLAELPFGLVAWVLTLLFVPGRLPPALAQREAFFRASDSALPIAALILSFASAYLLTFRLSFYLMQARHLRPALAGLVLAGYGLARVCTAPVSGHLSDGIGTKLPATLGAALLALGSLLLSCITPNAPLEGLFAALLLAGAGIGIFVPPNNSAILSAVPRSRYGLASGIIAMSRTAGMAIGVALAALVPSGQAGFALAASVAFATAVVCATSKNTVSRRARVLVLGGREFVNRARQSFVGGQGFT
ncbi:MAG: MFS transporter [Acidobacteriia bacterium]|nr:MFS transporter [Terriglobia bacterium]MBV8902422.1 MFS transporter [Terriglobia bacterium]